jgi:hypothetical protein
LDFTIFEKANLTDHVDFFYQAENGEGQLPAAMVDIEESANPLQSANNGYLKPGQRGYKKYTPPDEDDDDVDPEWVDFDPKNNR